jgi:hypothetical protein
MNTEQIKAAVLELMADNEAEKARIDKEWDSHYGDLSCTEYEANHAYRGALLDVLNIIDSNEICEANKCLECYTKEIKKIVDKTPNNMQLGKKIRNFIR